VATFNDSAILGGFVRRLQIRHSGIFLLQALSIGGCSAPSPSVSAPSVGQLAAQAPPTSSPDATQPVENRSSSKTASAATKPSPENQGRPAANVSGNPISMDQIVEPLLRSHGVTVLEDLIVVEMALREAEAKGLALTHADLQREHDLTLRKIMNPPGSMGQEPFDRHKAERLLQALRVERNISPEQFRLSLRRNALLRKLVEHERSFTEEDYRDELDRAYGERVRVRHIQLATLADVARIREKLDAGEDFAELARRFSANPATAAVGGLLDPFTARDDGIPVAVRTAAFKLSPGEVSPAVNVGEWLHLLRLEDRLPAESRTMEDVREDLTRRLHDRLSEPAIQELAAKLFATAEIRIYDTALREGFYQRHPGR
jgi:parvulin-like peptidyl-prolyl isomerase